MILTDREIKVALDHGMILIDPRPGDQAFSSTSVDLTLSPDLREFSAPLEDVEQVIDPGRPNYNVLRLLNRMTSRLTIPDTGYDLPPNKLVLGWTIERVELRMHARVAARVEGKSSHARVGLAIHVTAPTIHAGFQGPIQLEIINHGPIPIRLRPGMKVCQLIFEQTLGVPDRGYGGQFFGQKPA